MQRIVQFFRELLCWHMPVEVGRIEKSTATVGRVTVVNHGRVFYACEKCGKFPVYK